MVSPRLPPATAAVPQLYARRRGGATVVPSPLLTRGLVRRAGDRPAIPQRHRPEHQWRQRTVQPRPAPEPSASARPQPLRVDEEAQLPESAQPRQDEDERQVPRGVHGSPAPGAGEGVPLQPLHHHQTEGGTRHQPGPLRETGQNLVPEPARQGAQTAQEAGGAAPQGEDAAARHVVTSSPPPPPLHKHPPPPASSPQPSQCLCSYCNFYLMFFIISS